MESLLIRQAEALGAMTTGQKGLGTLPSKVNGSERLNGLAPRILTLIDVRARCLNRRAR
jgi:hypothetical protein